MFTAQLINDWAMVSRRDKVIHYFGLLTELKNELSCDVMGENVG
jgi:hypothetical protein